MFAFLKRRGKRRPVETVPVDPRVVWREAATGGSGYVGLWLFTLVLYLRPNDLLPIGDFPVAKIIGLGAIAMFGVDQVSSGRKLVSPPELKYFLGLMGLMLLSVPAGLDPGWSMTVLTDGVLKIFSVFLIIINAASSFRRIRRLLALTTLCGTIIALGTLEQSRGINIEDYRVEGFVRGMFGNPNDLALALNMFVPFACALAVVSRNVLGKMFHLGCALVMSWAMFLTYSRAGFLSFMAMGGWVVWRVGRTSTTMRLLGAIGAVAVLVLAPAGFMNRILSIFDHSLDTSGSASERTDIVWRSLEVSLSNPKVWLVGVGLDNFHIVSIHEKVNHNAYLQVFTEVGVPAGTLYLLFIFGAMKGTSWTADTIEGVRGLKPVRAVAFGLRASLIAYAVGSFFASVAYLWYVYYAVGFAVALRLLVERAQRAAVVAPPTPVLVR